MGLVNEVGELLGAALPGERVDAAGDAGERLDDALLARAEAASKRWELRTEARESRRNAVERGLYLEADSSTRLAARVNRLLGEVRRTSRDRRAPAEPKLRELMDRPAVTEADLNNDLVREAVLGARDFLSVEFFERGLAASRSVGRVVVRGGGRFRAHGTGFLVGPGLLLTNEHVLPSAAVAEGCAVEMDYEHNFFGKPKQVQRFALEPPRFFLNDPDLDFALVAVAPRSEGGVAVEDFGWLPLDGQQGKITVLPEDTINIVQHPLGREKEIVIRDNRILDLRTGDRSGDDQMGPFIHYKADTEKGSSGSPVLNDQWEVVALHHSGVPKLDPEGKILTKDGQRWDRRTHPFEAIAWVGNEGVRVSSLVAFIEKAKVGRTERVVLDRFLSAQSPGVLAVQTVAEEQGSPPVPGDGGGGAAGREGLDGDEAPGPAPVFAMPPTGRPYPERPCQASGAPTIDVEVPLRISIGLGRPTVSGATARAGGRNAAGAAADVRGDADVQLERLGPEDYADRNGFGETFLGVRVPLPAIKRAPRFGKPLHVEHPSPGQANPFELKYHHFSVVMNGPRRLAYLSAVNIDFDAPVGLGRKQGTGTWRFDPRIPDAAQIGGEYYAGNDYDRGHLTRRDDAAWGRTKAEARGANDDTFHWTNAAPQHRDFNQSDEFTHKNLKLWGDLENHIAAQGGDQRTRLCVFNGTVFRMDDKPLRDARVPKEFFKIVVFKDEGSRTPGAVGFVLSQERLIRRLGDEAIDPGEFAVRQRRIEAIDAIVDVDLGFMFEWDRMPPRRGRPQDENFEDDAPMRRLSDVVL